MQGSMDTGLTHIRLTTELCPTYAHHPCIHIDNGHFQGKNSFKIVLSLLFVCVEFYGTVNPMGSCRARSVYLTTRLLGRLSPLSG